MRQAGGFLAWGGVRLSSSSLSIIRAAFAAFFAGDLESLRLVVDPALEWTFLDPSEEEPIPRTCFGREELEVAATKWAKSGLTATLEELYLEGDKGVVVMHAPGLDRGRARASHDRNLYLVTLADDRVRSIRACRDREELEAIASRT